MARPRPTRTRNQLWTLAGVVALLVIAAVVVVLTRGDGGTQTTPPPASTSPTTSSSASATTTAPSGTTTTTGPATTTTTSLPALTPDDPRSYAQYFFAAWRNGDRSAAARVASAQAVDQMFSVPYDPARGYAFTGCGAAAGSQYCTWTATNGATLVVQVRTLTGGLPVQVIGVQRSD